MNTNIYEKARKGNRLLEAYWDRDCESPRTAFDNVSTMLISWNGYRLGDKPGEDPDDFIDEAFLKTFAEPENLHRLTNKLKKDKRLSFDRKAGVWKMEYRRSSGPVLEEICRAGELDDTRALEEICPLLPNGEKMRLLEPYGYLFQVLSIYEHGGLALHKGVDRGWDSGTCGFCVITEQKAREEGITGNWREWAQNIIDGEVEEYDDYLQGQVFGYRVYEMPQDDYDEMVRDNGCEPDDDEIIENGEVVEEEWGVIGFNAIREIISENSAA